MTTPESENEIEIKTIPADAVDETSTMIADIRRVWSAAQTPPELRAAFMRWHEENTALVDRLKAAMAANLAWWLVRGREAGHDPDILDQVALQAVQWVIAVTTRAMKERQGEPFEPARVAIVAYMVARMIAKAGGEAANLEGMAHEADRIGAFATSEADAEIKRLRAVIEEIADMDGLDLGEPELERVAIIDRCKAEMARWEKEDA